MEISQSNLRELRYFILSTSRPTILFCYSKKGDAHPISRFPMSTATTVSTETDTTTPVGLHTFQIRCDDYCLRLSAHSDDSLSKWIDAILSSECTQNLRCGRNFDLSVRRNVKVSGIAYQIEERYTPIKKIGHGSYGTVIAAHDKKRNISVAIKKIPNAFEDLVDARRVVREICVLRSLKHPNITSIVDLPTPPPPELFKDIYIVLDLVHTDLFRVIYERKKLSNSHIKWITYQLLCALKYLHSANVVHSDLKPQNILLSSNCDVKLCDFGLARSIKAPPSESSNGGDLTQYVVTRWYRAPELLLGCEMYTQAIDVWGLGCILGEMLYRKALFRGTDYIDQIRRIIEFVGVPDKEDDLSFLTNERAKKFLLSLPKNPPKDLSKFLPHADHKALDLIRKMLIIDPSKRISVDDAISHDFLASMRHHNLEAVSDFELDWGAIESVELTRENVQSLVYEEVDLLKKNMNTTNILRNGTTCAGILV